MFKGRNVDWERKKVKLAKCLVLCESTDCKWVELSIPVKDKDS